MKVHECSIFLKKISHGKWRDETSFCTFKNIRGIPFYESGGQISLFSKKNYRTRIDCSVFPMMIIKNETLANFL